MQHESQLRSYIAAKKGLHSSTKRSGNFQLFYKPCMNHLGRVKDLMLITCWWITCWSITLINKINLDESTCSGLKLPFPQVNLRTYSMRSVGECVGLKNQGLVGHIMENKVLVWIREQYWSPSEGIVSPRKCSVWSHHLVSHNDYNITTHVTCEAQKDVGNTCMLLFIYKTYNFHMHFLKN